MRSIQQSDPALSRRDLATLSSLLEVALPPGVHLPGADEATAEGVGRFLLQAPSAVAAGYRAVLWSIEANALLQYGRAVTRLEANQRLALLESWRNGDFARRSALRVLLAPPKVIHFSDPANLALIGCKSTSEASAFAAEPRPRWMEERILSAVDAAGQVIECDVVVIGTGAGGAVVAKELAEKGVAVVMVEEGEFYSRSDFAGPALLRQQRLYRDRGASFAVGNTAIFLPVGKSVGGTTTVNSGTCYRVPERVLRDWRERYGLRDFSLEMLDPFYSRVESIIGVREADSRYLGGIARVIARGCDALGYHHQALRRNAPDCDGQGTCCFGCPTDAKRSTNVSYVPLALRAGATLIKGLRIDEILVEGGRAVGVRANLAGPSTLRSSVTIRGRAVVVAGGALMTPLLLEENHLANSSGEVGRNLSIHPAAGAAALFDEEIRGFEGIPQGYAIDEFHEEGILFEGAFAPPDVTAASFSAIGAPFIEVMENYNRLAVFGFLIEDVSRGRVRRGPGGKPLVTYNLEAADVARLKRGVEILSRVYFAAGARKVMPVVHGFDEFRSTSDIEEFRGANVHARDFDLSAYHPLGTARMGADPRSSVVGADHQTHDVPGLYVVDGAAVPSSLSVNPQLTIMAMATRAADILAGRL